MGLLDQLLGGASQVDFASLGQRVGLSPEEAQAAASALLPKVADPNIENADATSAAAAETGIPQSKIEELAPLLAEHLPGEAGSLLTSALPSLLGSGGAGGILGALDKDGDGNPLNDVLGLFGRKL